jgi:hypothetical protein
VISAGNPTGGRLADGARQIGQGFQVGVRCQPLSLEAPHLAARSGRTIETRTADDPPHGGVAGEPTEHQLAEQPIQLVAQVLTAAAIEELRDRGLGEPKDVIQLTVGEQAAVGRDPGTCGIRA